MCEAIEWFACYMYNTMHVLAQIIKCCRYAWISKSWLWHGELFSSVHSILFHKKSWRLLCWFWEFSSEIMIKNITMKDRDNKNFNYNRIEARWSQLRRLCTHWWQEFFKVRLFSVSVILIVIGFNFEFQGLQQVVLYAINLKWLGQSQTWME